MADKTEIDWPKNLSVSGLMSFPLYSLKNIDALKEWRANRSIGAPRYPDRIGFTLLLNQQQHDKVVSNLKDVYLPFAATLWGLTDKKKGIDPKLIAKLSKLVEEQDWSESNLPIRDLSDKNIANLEKNNIDGIVSKLKLAGPPNDVSIKIKALAREDEDDPKSPYIVTTLAAVADKLGEADPEALWFGSSWPFRTAVRFNAYNAANHGVSAYVRDAYLYSDKELTTFGRGDADVLEDGDDWSDE